eukprot:478806-Rhodomonas_salina.1
MDNVRKNRKWREISEAMGFALRDAPAAPVQMPGTDAACGATRLPRRVGQTGLLQLYYAQLLLPYHTHVTSGKEGHVSAEGGGGGGGGDEGEWGEELRGVLKLQVVAAYEGAHSMWCYRAVLTKRMVLPAAEESRRCAKRRTRRGAG